jgi:hypothetical protein
MEGNYEWYASGNNVNIAALANAVFTNTCLGLWIGTGGTLHVQFGEPQINSDANNVTFHTNAVFTNIANGTLLPIKVNLIYSDSLANNVVVLF